MRGIILETDRLILKPIILKNAKDVTGLVNKNVVKFFGAIPWPYILDDSKKWIRSIVNNKKLFNWIIIRKSDNKIIKIPAMIEINHESPPNSEVLYFIIAKPNTPKIDMKI